MSDRLEKIGYIEGRGADEVYREKTIENYIIKDSSIEEAKKYLQKDERIGRRIHCRETENYILLAIDMSGKQLFFNKKGKEIKFLYDSISLMGDWNKNQGFLQYKDSIPEAYLHLAISGYRDLNLFEKFIAEIRAAKGGITHKEIENVMLFRNPQEGFSLWILACLNLSLIKEAGFAARKLAELYFLDKNKRKEFLEYVDILSSKYTEFYSDFKKGRFDKIFSLMGASSAYPQPDRSQKIYSDSTISSTDGEIYFREGEASIMKSDGTKIIIRKDKKFYPSSLGFLGNKISEFFHSAKDKGYMERKGEEFIIDIWIERIREILDKVEQGKADDVSKPGKIEELFPDVSFSPVPPYVSFGNLVKMIISPLIYIKDKINDFRLRRKYRS